MMSNHLFVDSDGVFFDFHGHFETLFGVHPDRIKDDELWPLANSRADFWPTMPLKAGAKELWAAIRHVHPTVLTGAPKSDYDNAVRHKLQAWEDHFQHKQVITCLSKDKAMHMRDQGDWLVDDMSKNTKKWDKAGGRSYRYDGNWERCVAFLKQHGAI